LPRRRSPPRAGFSAAPSAAPTEIHIILLNLKLIPFDVRQWDPVEARILNINNTPTFQTDKMMMSPELRIETRRRPRMTGPRHQTKRNKRRQNTMNRHAGNLRKFAANRAIKLLSGRMIHAIKNCFKDRSPLGRDRQTALAMRREKTLYSLLFIRLTHLPEMSDYTR
jgi:hypothetical protein